MKSIIYSITFLFCFTLKAKDFARSPEWLSLLRYEKSLIGFKSIITKDEFFVSKNGRFNPGKELEKTIFLFNNDKEYKLTCKLPARALLLKKHKLILNKIDLKNCKKYQDLKNKLNLKSIHLIFSSYFINSPASAFGHTFLKLRSHDSAKQDNDLLDYGLDFSAQVTTKNPIMYGVLGITGGFRGAFKLMPYYYKIREYKNVESRDLWDFELNFTNNELDYFVAQLIELETSSFDYYYLTQNCSYHILALINALRPSLKLMDKLNLIVPPVDTIYALKDTSDFIKDTHYGPSAYKKMTTRISTHNSNEANLFKKILIDKDNYSKILNDAHTFKEKLNILETYSLYLDYTQAKTHYGERDKEYKKNIHYILKLNHYRSTIQGQTQTLDFSSELDNSPLNGHKTRRFKLAYIKQLEDKSNQYLLEYRVALHDLLQIQKGFIPNSTTQMGRFELLFDKDKLRLNNFELVGVEALRVPTLVEHRFSWRFHMGIKDNEYRRQQNIIPYLDLSFGKSYNIKKSLLSVFMRTQNSISSAYDNNYQLEVGPELHFVINLHNFAFLADYSYLKIFNQNSKIKQKFNLKFQYNFDKDFAMFSQYETVKTSVMHRKLLFGLNISI